MAVSFFQTNDSKSDWQFIHFSSSRKQWSFENGSPYTRNIKYFLNSSNLEFFEPFFISISCDLN